jgi:PAS domain S-box-containing protein
MDGAVFKQLVEVSSDVATIIDPDGTISYVSPSVTETLGYEPEELIGERGFDYQHPADREAVAEAIERLQAGAEGPETIETRFRRADSSWCWIEATLQNRMADPDIDGILVCSREITDRKAQEQEYRDLAREYRTLLDNVDDGIFFLSIEQTDTERIFRFERLNTAYEEQTGITTEEVQNETPIDVFGPELGAQLEANYRRCARAREPIRYQEEVPVEPGARYWQTSLAPVISDGSVTRIIGITRNVTEQVERERQLRKQKEQLDEFAGVVSHDLRNPLNVAQGRAALLAEECDSDHLGPILDALDRIGDIVSDTLTLAREGRIVADKEPVQVTDLVGACWNTVSTGDATVDVVDDMTIQGDSGRLQHVFENLFRNAVEHGPAENDNTADQSEQSSTELTVRIGRLNDHGFYVEDSGIGIPEESREAVFETGHTSSRDGTGFGLTIVRRIAQAHGWEVAITDGSFGGSRFEFTGVDLGHV